MPFYNQIINILVEQDPFPDITQKDFNKKPTKTSLVLLNGGKAGGLGEKSYEPEVFLSQVDNSASLNNLLTTDYNNFSYTKINSQNDTGYAIKFETDVSNACNLTVGHYNSSSGINIYSSSTDFTFSTLYTGSVSSAITLNNGSWFGDANNFQVVFGAGGVTTVQDTDLDLNRYYLELRDPDGTVDNAEGKLFLQSQAVTTSNLFSLFAFYVVELDLYDDYSTYTTADFSWDRLTPTSNITLNNNIFNVGDVVSISHPLDYFNIVGTVSYSVGSNIKITMTNTRSSSFNLPTNAKNYVVFPVGSKVCINDLNGNNLAFVVDQTGTYTDYKSKFRTTNGFNFSIKKQITSADKEVYNSLTFEKDKFANFNNQITTVAKTVQRIGARDYLIDQYGSDATKLKIKNKTKLGIVYHGVENINNVWTYFCGNEKNRFTTVNGNKPSILNSANVYLIVGNSTLPVLDNGQEKARSYHSSKLYEVLLYKNLSSSNIETVVNSLIEKYKQKLYFSSAVEFQNSDMYYSSTDRLNILGKIIKNSS